MSTSRLLIGARAYRLSGEGAPQTIPILRAQPLFGFTTREPLRYRKLPTTGTTDVYYIEDDELDCIDLIKAPLPPIPLAPTYTGV